MVTIGTSQEFILHVHFSTDWYTSSETFSDAPNNAHASWKCGDISRVIIIFAISDKGLGRVATTENMQSSQHCTYVLSEWLSYCVYD